MTRREKIVEYLIDELQLDVSKSELEDETPLLSSGILDSISALQLVDFLEKEFGFEFQAHEVDQDNLDSIHRILMFIDSKTTA